LFRITESESTIDTTSNTASTTPTSTTPQGATLDNIPKYTKLLVPYDHSEMSDKALSHAIYLSKLSGSEIIILKVLEHLEKTFLLTYVMYKTK
jgi:hypothetical protein